MAVTRMWKIWGWDGHRQRESFNLSHSHDFSNKECGTRIIEVFNCDKTGTNDYTIVKITRDSAEDCERELLGQESDGIFENSRTGKIEEIFEFDEVKKVERRRKFEIIKKTAEIRLKNINDIKEGAAIDCEYPEVLEKFDTLEEAKEAFGKYESEIREFRNGKLTFFDVTEYYLEESDCDDDLPVPDIDVWGISPMKINVVDEESGETVGVFSSYEDAKFEVVNSDDILSIEFQ